MDPITQQVVLATAGAAAGDATYVDDVFSTFLYDGTGSGASPAVGQTINNGIDLSGEGGLVWFKNRDYQYPHRIYDTERGANEFLESNSTAAEVNATHGLTAFNSNGFTIGTMPQINEGTSGYEEHVSWTFRKAPGFFDVVTYTGDGTAGKSIAHNLGSVPGMIIVKRLDATANWRCQHRSLGAGKHISLDRDTAASTNTQTWNNTAPTSTVFSVGSSNDTNANGGTYVAYVFAHDDQSFGTDSDEAIIKCGTWTGTSSAFNLDIGFEAQWIMYKSTSQTGNWTIVDNMRGLTVQGSDSKALFANTTATESGSGNYPAPYAKGFRPITGGQNQSGVSYIYMAIRRPHKPPTAGTEVFAVDNQGTGTMPPQYHSNFVVDWAINVAFGESQAYRYRLNFTRLLGGTALKLNEAYSEINFSSARWDYMDGFFNNNSSVSTTYSWMFKRTPGFFDVVAYTGTGSAGSFSHNLAATPQLLIHKSREQARSWVVYTTVIDGSMDYMYLNQTGGAGNSSSGLPTSTVFNLSGGTEVNGSGEKYIAYLFATLDGISKVGIYSGTGNDVNVDCGFSGGARFVMIKRTENPGGDWYVWDTTRGIVSGNDPYFLLNTDGTEVTNTDYIDPLNAGFTVTSSAPAALNTSGGTYLFLAIA